MLSTNMYAGNTCGFLCLSFQTHPINFYLRKLYKKVPIERALLEFERQNRIKRTRSRRAATSKKNNVCRSQNHTHEKNMTEMVVYKTPTVITLKYCAFLLLTQPAYKRCCEYKIIFMLNLFSIVWCHLDIHNLIENYEKFQ